MTLVKGIYRHYKGNLYEVLGVAQHSETLEYLVIYKTLYGDFSTWVRPLDMFQESVEKDGQQVARFEFVEPSEESSD
jgi:hypothetical protein|tara:strand:- start:10133 stop:10363 length:231 start_codon:yes stop_codon:yes gene_type:complete